MPVIVQGTDFVKLPVGTTSQRPPTPALSMIRVNSTTKVLEVYTGTQWITWKAF
jgi:hypothetical protein